MKIKVIETVTEIEATASEINASQTLSGKFAAILANVTQQRGVTCFYS